MRDVLHPSTVLSFLNQEVPLVSNTFKTTLGTPITYIAVVFLVIVLVYIYSKQKVHQEIEKHISDLEELNNLLVESDGSTDLKEEMDRHFKNKDDSIESLRILWIEFSEGMVQHNSTWQNVFQAEDFFTEELLVDHKIIKVEHIPPFFSALGLLFTFIALAAGLGELHYDESSQTISHGLGIFINALSAKFITSIMGLGLALGYDSSVLRKHKVKLKELSSSIVNLLNKNFKRLTSEHVLLELNQTTSEIPGRIQNFFDSSSGDSQVLNNLQQTITESVSKSVGGIQAEINKVSNALEGFTARGVQDMSGHLADIGKEIRESLAQGVSKDLENLTNTMQEMPEIIKSTLQDMEQSTNRMKEDMSSSQKEMARLITEFIQDVSSKQGDNINELLDNLVTKNQEINQQLVLQQEATQKKIQESLELVTDKLQENTNESSIQMNMILEQVKSTFESSTNQFRESIESQHQQSQEMINTLLNNIGQSTSGLTENLEQSVTRIQGDYNEFAQQSKAAQDEQVLALQSVFKESYKQIADTQKDLKDILEPITTELKNNVIELSRQTSNLPEKLNGSSQALMEATDRIKLLLNNEMSQFLMDQSDINEKQSQTITKLGEHVNNIALLQSESQKVQATMDKLVETQSKIMNSSNEKDIALENNIESLLLALNQQEEISRKFSDEYQKLSDLSQRLPQTFGEVGEKLANSINKVKDASHNYFDDFSKYHGEAIGQLKGFVEQMGDVIEEAQSRYPVNP